MSSALCSSCFLIGTEDSLAAIYKTLGDAAQISKWAGGIGLHVSNVRAKGSFIASTSGVSDGIVPMLKVFNETARYCNQAGRRKGSIAVYLEPWHADVWDFVELRRNTGAETERCRDLFLALWVPDEFMRRVLADDWWYLMSPDVCPGLVDAVGDAFSELYAGYVEEGRFVRRVRARALWDRIIAAQLETGVPYVLFKDASNRKSNQANLGTVRSSNLCAEIIQYSDADTHAVCNLASIAVNRFLVGVPTPGKPENGELLAVDHGALHEVAKLVTLNLNRIIDINAYPTPGARESNKSTRPIGIGVQGLADLYCALGLPYESEAAVNLDAEVTFPHPSTKGRALLFRFVCCCAGVCLLRGGVCCCGGGIFAALGGVPLPAALHALRGRVHEEADGAAPGADEPALQRAAAEAAADAEVAKVLAVVDAAPQASQARAHPSSLPHHSIHTRRDGTRPPARTPGITPPA